MLHKKFLLVEDDLDDQILFTEIFNDVAPDCQCDIVDDGYEAIKYLASSTPDCVITDMNMPKLSGLDLARIITNELKLAIPIIIWSTKPPDVVQLHDAGVIATFSKPYDIAHFYAFIEKILSITTCF